MELRRYQDVATFRRDAEPFLVRHEAEHNLLFGLAAALAEGFSWGDQPPYLATVVDGDVVVAAALMTPPHNLVLSLVSPSPGPDALAPLAEDLRRLYPALPGVLGPRPASRTFAALWQRTTGQPYQPGTAQRIYQLDAVRPVSPVPGELREATVAERPLLIEWVMAFNQEIHGAATATNVDARLASTSSGYHFWYDGGPVSLAGYSGPTPHGIRVGPVYTPPEHRRRGYASACVAALSQLLLDSGRRYCFLFTDLANPTSNRIYQEIGYRPVCDVDEYRFLTSSEGLKV